MKKRQAQDAQYFSYLRLHDKPNLVAHHDCAQLFSLDRAPHGKPALCHAWPKLSQYGREGLHKD